MKILGAVLEADAHFASKNTLLKRNTLLHKSLTHFASKSILQSHDLLLSTPCSLTPFATQNPLLLITPCFSAHSAPQNTLLLSTLCFKEHFTPRNTLLLNTLCFLTPFAPWNTLLLRTLCSLTPFAHWNTLLLRIFSTPWFTYMPNTIFFDIFTLKFKSESGFIHLFHIMVKWIPRSIMSWGAKCSREQSVLRSKVFQGAKGVKE